MIKTTRAFIIKDSKILLVSGYGTYFYWTPGGEIEEDETPDITLKRELKEDLGLELLKFESLSIT